MSKAIQVIIRLALIAVIVAVDVVEEHYAGGIAYGAGVGGLVANLLPFVSIVLVAWLGGRAGFLTGPLPLIAIGIYDYVALDPLWKEYEDCWAGSLIGAFILGLPVGCITSVIHYNRALRPRSTGRIPRTVESAVDHDAWPPPPRS